MARRRTETWTPYGLEAIRVAHLRRRQLLSLLLALGLAGLWMVLASTGIQEERSLEITDGRGSRISIDVSDAEQRRDGPLTVAVNPGRVTRADTGAATGAGGAPIASFAAPVYERGDPFPWRAYVLFYGPFVLLVGAIWLLSRRKGRAEVNYGIYKGAMPLEMITASAARHVLTHREARRSLFGKRRVDYLPHELVVVERMPAEEDA